MIRYRFMDKSYLPKILRVIADLAFVVLVVSHELWHRYLFAVTDPLSRENLSNGTKQDG